MKEKDFETRIENIKTKLGEENVSLIADDLGILITDNSQMNTTLNSKDNEISKLQKDKEMLITTNGNLLQQVAMGTEDNIYNKETNEEEKPKYINFR